MSEVRSDQHCILFTSDPHIDDLELCAAYKHMNLSSSLRSTSEIVHFVENYRSSCQFNYSCEIECKPAHNFHGEKPDIRIVTQNNDKSSDLKSEFITESVSTIVKYFNMSANSEFLPVIASVSKNVRKKIESNLIAKGYPIAPIRSDPNMPGENYINTLPRNNFPLIRFMQPWEVNGAEFGIMVVLMLFNQDNIGTSEREIFYCFPVMTRASLKIAVVYSSLCDDNLDVENYLKKTISGKRVEKFLENLENQRKKVILVGSNYKFFALKQKPYPTEIDVPNIEGTRVLTKSRGGVIFQVDDIYNSENIEELKRFGIEIILIVGENSISEFSKRYFKSTMKLLESAHETDQFKIVDILTSTVTDASALLNWHRFMKTPTINIIKQERVRAGDKFSWIFQDNIPESGLSSDWAKWKAKAAAHCGLKDSIYALKMYKVSYSLLACQCQSLKKETERKNTTMKNKAQWYLMMTMKELAKLKMEMSEQFFEAAGHHSLADGAECSDPTTHISADFTLESCLYEALSSALTAICLQVFSERSCERSLKANKKSQVANNSKKEEAQLLENLIDHDQTDAKRLSEKNIFENYFTQTNLAELQAKANKKLYECLSQAAYNSKKEKSKLLEVLIDHDQTDVERLRDRELGTETNPADLEEIKRQRESYMKKLASQNIAELVERRLELANNFSDLARTKFENIKEKKFDSSNSDKILSSHTLKIERLKVTSFRFAMEALEWNPNQSEVLSTLRKNLSLLSILVRDILSRATDMKKENFRRMRDFVLSELQDDIEEQMTYH